MAARIGTLFPDSTVERYDGLHHMNTSHQAEPQRVAAALERLWARAGDWQSADTVDDRQLGAFSYEIDLAENAPNW